METAPIGDEMTKEEKRIREERIRDHEAYIKAVDLVFGLIEIENPNERKKVYDDADKAAQRQLGNNGISIYINEDMARNVESRWGHEKTREALGVFKDWIYSKTIGKDSSPPKGATLIRMNGAKVALFGTEKVGKLTFGFDENGTRS